LVWKRGRSAVFFSPMKKKEELVTFSAKGRKGQAELFSRGRGGEGGKGKMVEPHSKEKGRSIAPHPREKTASIHLRKKKKGKEKRRGLMQKREDCEARGYRKVEV